MSLAAFRSLTLHGNVLPTDALTRAADLGMPGQSPDDYQLTPGLAINAAVARSWNDLLVAWERRQAGLQTARGGNATRLTRERWLLPLLGELGYGRVPVLPAGLDLPPGLGETKPAHYPISHQLAWPAGDPTPSAAVAIHLLGDDIELDKRTTGLTARAPHGMIQEVLNRTHTHLYAILATGQKLRLLRDASSLAKQSYVEFDLDLMFREQLFADYRLLWLTLHATRLSPRTQETVVESALSAAATDGDDPGSDLDDQPAEPAAPIVVGPRPDDCWLEDWRTQAISEGTRARDQLEAGVAAALTALGTGFLRHPANAQLRTALADVPDADQDLRRTLLKIVYRFIVLFVAEDRDLLHTTDATPEARILYAEYFSTARLRRAAATRAGSRHHDLWPTHLLVTDALGANGLTTLGLPPLSEPLYSRSSLGLLADAQISNRALLEALRHLSQVKDKRTGNPVRIDYRNLDSEELGGVYEGLLAYVPRYDPDTQTFSLEKAAGSDRKTSGSYYTPSDMISLVLDEALDPLIDTALRDEDPERALLTLTVCDPACGSGHFLVAAARRLARALATARTGDPEPAPAAVREAMRDVVSRCIYGVDLNDLALEVAKVALWLEALTPGKPFAYLDHHLKVGNALLGTTPALLAKNIPDAAFKVLHGDDKDRTSKLKKRNRDERRHTEIQAAGQLAYDICTLDLPTIDISKRADELDLEPADTIEQIRQAADAWRRLNTDPKLQDARLLHDAWCTAFIQLKIAADAGPGITHQTLLNLRKDPNSLRAETVQVIRDAARKYRFFHWHLEFPSVFTVPDTGSSTDNLQGWNGGFSALIGNPPWESIEFKDKEFFASAGRLDVSSARTASARDGMISELATSDPALFARYWAEQRTYRSVVHLLSASGRFALTGNGKIATHDLFTEHTRDLTATRGSSGILIPTSLMTGAQTAPFVADLLAKQQFGAFYDFTNSGQIFPGVHSSYRFGILHVTGRQRRSSRVRLAFHLTSVSALTSDRLIQLTADDLTRINPNTKNLPMFSSPADAQITAAVHNHVPILLVEGDPAGNPWQFSAGRMFNMSDDAHLFYSAEALEAKGGTFDGFAWVVDDRRYLPLHEGKHVWHYDHRYSTGRAMPQDKTRAVTDAEHDQGGFEIETRHYMLESEVGRKMSHRTGSQWLIGWRGISSPTNQRCLVLSVFPRTAAGDSLPLIDPERPMHSILLVAALSAIACDYVVRQKQSGANVLKFIVNQAPVPHPDTFAAPAPWQPTSTLQDWLHPRVLELSFTSWSLQPWAVDVGDNGPPFRWDPERRAVLQAEIDGAMFHIYGLDREQTSHVLGTFRALRDAETRTYGEFRTERLVLAEYDRMAAAIAAGGAGWLSTLDVPAGKGSRHPG
ncbi:MAG: N-6 DNA methylase [Actinomycetota bacterium]|nr:N-6 DNA methylase [Actinomycetota bacterium]